VTKFIQCEQCKMKIPGDKCEFAAYRCVVDGEEHVFCCQKCAERYQKKRRD
jgi:YHS domain-containing protein